MMFDCRITCGPLVVYAILGVNTKTIVKAWCPVIGIKEKDIAIAEVIISAKDDDPTILGKLGKCRNIFDDFPDKESLARMVRIFRDNSNHTVNYMAEEITYIDTDGKVHVQRGREGRVSSFAFSIIRSMTKHSKMLRFFMAADNDDFSFNQKLSTVDNLSEMYKKYDVHTKMQTMFEMCKIADNILDYISDKYPLDEAMSLVSDFPNDVTSLAKFKKIEQSMKDEGTNGASAEKMRMDYISRIINPGCDISCASPLKVSIIRIFPNALIKQYKENPSLLDEHCEYFTKNLYRDTFFCLAKNTLESQEIVETIYNNAQENGNDFLSLLCAVLNISKKDKMTKGMLNSILGLGDPSTIDLDTLHILLGTKDTGNVMDNSGRVAVSIGDMMCNKGCYSIVRDIKKTILTVSIDQQYSENRVSNEDSKYRNTTSTEMIYVGRRRSIPFTKFA